MIIGCFSNIASQASTAENTTITLMSLMYFSILYDQALLA